MQYYYQLVAFNSVQFTFFPFLHQPWCMLYIHNISGALEIFDDILAPADVTRWDWTEPLHCYAQH